MAEVLFQRESEGSKQVMEAIDLIDAHMLPFFSSKASTGELQSILKKIWLRIQLGNSS